MAGRRNLLQKGRSPVEWIFIGGAILLLLSFIVYNFPRTYRLPSTYTPTTPAAVVQQFYEYERIGDFGSSWELFHSVMKTRFNKQAYIQQRAKVLMQDFGVEKFDYSVGSPVTVRSLKPAPDAVPIDTAYRVPVVQTFKSIFGTFSLSQDVYVADENGKLRILWVY
jgi:hypothetical protein